MTDVLAGKQRAQKEVCDLKRNKIPRLQREPENNNNNNNNNNNDNNNNNNKTILKSQQRFRSEARNVYMEKANKIAFSENEDKRLQTVD